MAKQSIGELSAIITANAQQFVDELQRTRASVDSVTTSVAQSGAQTAKSINAGIIGTRLFSMAFYMLRSEVQTTIKDIENIPGISQETIDSVNQMRYAFEGNNSALKTGVATLAGWFADIGLGFGYIVGNIDAAFRAVKNGASGIDAAKAGFDSMVEGYTRLQKEADAWANKDYTANLAKLTEQFDRLSVTSKGKMAAMLQDEAAILQHFSDTGVILAGKYKDAMVDALAAQMQMQGGVTEKDQQDASLQAMRDKIQAQQTINTMLNEARNLELSIGVVSDKERRSQMGTVDAIKQINDELAKLYRQKIPDLSDKNIDPIALEKEIDGLKKIKALESERAQDIRKLSTEVKGFGGQVADAFVNSLSGAGDAWKNLGRTIIAEILKIAVESEILQPLFHMMGGFATSAGFSTMGSALSGVMFGGMFAGGGDPPVGKVSWVGENGPELFVPKTSGTIIPAGMSGAMSAQRQGDTYYIDATGADTSAIARLAEGIASVNGSIEMRSVAAVLQQAKRSPSFRRSMSA